VLSHHPSVSLVSIDGNRLVVSAPSHEVPATEGGSGFNTGQEGFLLQLCMAPRVHLDKRDAMLLSERFGLANSPEHIAICSSGLDQQYPDITSPSAGLIYVYERVDAMSPFTFRASLAAPNAQNFDNLATQSTSLVIKVGRCQAVSSPRLAQSLQLWDTLRLIHRDVPCGPCICVL
jgi:hypothetical protein